MKKKEKPPLIWEEYINKLRKIKFWKKLAGATESVGEKAIQRRRKIRKNYDYGVHKVNELHVFWLFGNWLTNDGHKLFIYSK